GIDYRSDFYSLGVTFYQLLTGELPFSSNDPMELVHCHIAKTATPGHKINPQIPTVVSAIISKLMAKNAEDRYQSILGLRYDLEQCQQQLQATDKIAEFPIAQRDISDRFIIPDKLYGREEEVKTLLQAFTRVSTGATEMMLISGFSGIGKTTVVNEVHKPILRQRGYFIKGKYDQFQRNIPFNAFVQAFRDLMGQLLTENQEQIQLWKSKILEAVGENGQVIIEVIHELEIIIGKQPPVIELSGISAQNRFNLLFPKFVRVFTSKEHPLIIFLDDLQWADSSSLKLIQLLMSELGGYLLLIGAYRDNEVSAAHPLMLTLEKIKKEKATINTINLAPLSNDSLNQLVADTLNCTLGNSQQLTQLIYQKTQGNPFFSTQFLKLIYENGLIKFVWECGNWQCDISKVQELSLSNDVVEFMSAQLKKLPEITQNILKIAACIGNQFDLKTLSIVLQQSEIEVAAGLWQVLQEGLISPQSEIYKFYLSPEAQEIKEHTQIANYKFSHDRVQQAAYALIPENQRPRTHYQIGKLLLQRISPVAREEKIFTIVNQLNYGTALINVQNERNELAKLNLIACRKAKNSSAYQVGGEYARVGLYLLGKNSWHQQYEMCLEFHNLAAEFAWLCGDFENMEQLIDAVITHVKSLVEQVNVYRIRILANTSHNKLNQALNIGMELLQKLGVNFPQNPTQNDIQQALIEIGQFIEDREISDLLELSVMTDREKIAILQITNSIFPSVFFSNSPLFPLLVANSVKLSIQYGNTDASIYLIKLILGYLFGEFELANNYAVEARKFLMGVLGNFNESVFYFYDSLLALASVNSQLQNISAVLEQVEKNQIQLKHWADYAPMNHQHKVDLVEAEKCRLLGQKIEAIELYDKAIAGAKINEYIQEQALANELAAKFYLDWGKEKFAQSYLIDACYCYSNWGAKAKVEQLKNSYSQLLSSVINTQNNNINFDDKHDLISDSSSTSTSAQLDLETVTKAALAITSEIYTDQLISKLMQVTLENLGANKAALILQTEENLILVAYSENSQQCNLQSTPVNTVQNLPLSIINYVANSRENLLINNAINEHNYFLDPYIINNQPKSILCTPILNQGQLIGIIYLENSLTIDVFTPKRLKILKLLSSQAAISLENAQLYSNLEEKVANRTKELNAKNLQLEEILDELKRTQTQLIQTEKMSSLGQTVAGVAHEINNPVNFIYANIEHNESYMNKLIKLVKLYQQEHTNPSSIIQKTIKDIDLDFLIQDSQKIFGSMRIGAERIRNIVLGLRNFSRLDEADMKPVDIHEGIENTLMILQSRFKEKLDDVENIVIKNYAQLPLVNCYASQLNQVFMNMLNNAIDALSKRNQQLPLTEQKIHPSQIIISTQLLNPNWVRISLQDNGLGMTEEIKKCIFDPFFTTKEVGQGTGLGLSISYQIIVNKHHGKIECISQPGRGAEFLIDIPIQ
ncbi:AAA family ATPase, partial [Nodularia sp. UHCC 0506]|uniref:ATP-binding sensor histidine kinase n=1 Tax=Nodularia sp. UHCC 0506 TaxID=3110243 RepID=UPI002B1F3CB9